jgi:BirA family biotin operon repressor/biotin-[acetyl-CoA-carboxylase] ligase
MVEDLDLEKLRAHITGRWGESITVLKETSSTMDDAEAAARAGAVDGHVIVADRQTHGRGAHGRTWVSPSGTDLYFSVVARPMLEPSEVSLVTLATGLGVRDAIATLLPDRRVTVKWPNDVWIDRRKCAGILVESKMTGERVDAVVIGVGLNVNREAWPPELEGIATSIRQERGGAPLNRVETLARVLSRIESWVTRLVEEGAPALVAALRPNLALLGQRVRWEDGEGIFEGIDDRGAARVRTDSRLATLHAARFEPID